MGWVGSGRGRGGGAQKEKNIKHGNLQAQKLICSTFVQL